MMRFRVIAWLAALVVLAGCVASNVEESISRAADGLVVQKTCDYSIDESFSTILDRQFLISSSGVLQVPIDISEDKKTIYIRNTRFNALIGCAFRITSLDFEAGTPIALSFDISPSTGPILPSEQKEYQNQIVLCERLSAFAARIKFNNVVGPYLESGGAIESDGFPGCTVVVDNYSIIFEVKTGGLRFRIAMIMDQLITTRIEGI